MKNTYKVALSVIAFGLVASPSVWAEQFLSCRLTSVVQGQPRETIPAVLKNVDHTEPAGDDQGKAVIDNDILSSVLLKDVLEVKALFKPSDTGIVEAGMIEVNLADKKSGFSAQSEAAAGATVDGVGTAVTVNLSQMGLWSATLRCELKK